MSTTSLRDTKNGSFSAAEHLEFLKNKTRISAFKKAFEKLAQGKVVLDVGTGSGIMAILAARAGAKKVIAIEKDPVIAEIARRNFERNGLQDKIQLIVGDALEVKELPRVDILVGELLSTWGIVEPQVPVFKHLLSIIGNQAKTIPGRIVNQVQGVNARFGDEDDLVIVPTTYFEFSDSEKADSLTSRVTAFELIFSKDILNPPSNFGFSIDRDGKTFLSRDMDLERAVFVTLHATKSGTLNALRLSSITETVEGVTFGATNDTMPDMIVPLPKEIQVTKGDLVRLKISFTHGGGWESFSVEVL